MSVATSDFDLRAVYEAMDEQRRSREMSWATVTRELNRFKNDLHLIATSTIRSLQTKRAAEGGGILQMLLWLGRTPESFIPGFEDADAKRYHLRVVGNEQILRWDTRALYSALNAQREARGMTWHAVVQEVTHGMAPGVGGCTESMLTNMAKGSRAVFPTFMRIVGWLGQPAASFTRASDW